MCLNCIFWQIVTVEYWLSDLKPGLSQGLSAFLRANNENWSMVGVGWRGKEQTLIAVQWILDSEAVWQFISTLLHNFFSSEVKQVFNRHCTTELKQSQPIKSNFCSFLSANFSILWFSSPPYPYRSSLITANPRGNYIIFNVMEFHYCNRKPGKMEDRVPIHLPGKER